MEYERALQKAEQQITPLRDEIDDVKKRRKDVDSQVEGGKDAAISKLKQQGN
jgi:predicted  nucleic acid-binding Zn-ribbon protein